jgi:Phage integrase family.
MASIPTTANRVVTLLSNLWNYARSRDNTLTALGNPADAIRRRRYIERPRKRIATPAELRAFLRAVDACEKDGTIRACEAVALLLVPYALMRPNEIVHLQWAWVHLPETTISIPWEHAKGARRARETEPEIVALSKPMVDRLAALERTDDLVVPSVYGGSKSSLGGPWHVVRERAGIPADLHHYDLKATSLSMLRRDGVPDAWRHAAARHREQGVQERHYAQASLEEARKAMSRLAVLLDRAR